MERLYGWALTEDSGVRAPGATVTIYEAGTLTLASIFSDDGVTPKANPFTADADSAYWFGYAANGRYDVKFSGTGIPVTWTLADILVLDTAAGGYIETLNAQGQAAQTLVAGTAGTDFAISSLLGVHTFNLPNAGAAARGVVSTGAQTFAGAKTFSTPIAAGSGGSGVDGSAAANGRLLIGNGAGFTLAPLTQAANLGVTITNGAGSIALGTVQDIQTTAQPTFLGTILTGFYDGILGTPPLTFSNFSGGGGGTLQMNDAGECWPAILADGELLIGQTGAEPLVANLAAGSGISITNAPGSITIANAGILSINSTVGALTITTGLTGTDFALSQIGTNLQFNLPDAGESTRGAINTGTQDIAGAKSFLTTPLFIPGSAASTKTPQRLSGLVEAPQLISAANTDAGEDTLQTITMPANALDSNSQSMVRCTAWGTVAANANSKTIKLKLGSTVLAQLGASTALNALIWKLEAIVFRRASANSERAMGWGSAGANSAAPVLNDHRGPTALTADLTTDLDFTVTGEGVASNDILCYAFYIEVLA